MINVSDGGIESVIGVSTDMVTCFVNHRIGKKYNIGEIESLPNNLKVECDGSTKDTDDPIRAFSEKVTDLIIKGIPNKGRIEKFCGRVVAVDFDVTTNKYTYNFNYAIQLSPPRKTPIKKMRKAIRR